VARLSVELQRAAPGALVLGCTLAVFGAVTYERFSQPSELWGHYHGDLQDELSPHIAGINFERCGFLALKLQPAIARVDPDCAFELSDFYTHCPPGPHLVGGLLHQLGLKSFHAKKLAMYLLLVAFLTFLGLGLRRLFDELAPRESRALPWVVGALALCSPWLLFWSGHLYRYPYCDLFVAACLWALAARRYRAYLALAFTASLFTIEVIPCIFLMAAGRLLLDHRAERIDRATLLRWSALAMAAPTLGVGLHFLQTIWLFGDTTAALNDWSAAFLKRTGVTRTYSLPKHILKLLYSTLWYYGGPLLLLAAVGLRASVKARALWPAWLLGAGLSWQLAFRQHAEQHAYTNRHIGVPLLLLAAWGLLALWRGGRSRRLACVALVLLSLLRVPLGGEVSTNPVLLQLWTAAVSRAATGDLLAVLEIGAHTSEHRREKTILLDELSRRAGGESAASNTEGEVDRYVVRTAAGVLELGRLPRGFSTYGKNLPPAYLPPLEAEAPSYSSHRLQPFSPPRRIAELDLSDQDRRSAARLLLMAYFFLI